MFFDNLTEKQKMYVQKNIFANKKFCAAYYMQKGEDGLLHVGVIDISNHTTEAYLVYKFNNYELVDICNENNESVVDVSQSKMMNPATFNYNKAIGKFSKEYQEKALEYFDKKSQQNLPPARKELYANYKISLALAYADMNDDLLAKKKIQEEINL